MSADNSDRPCPFHRIMAAVDDSPQAQWAADVAASLACGLPSQLALVHVVPDIVVSFDAEFVFADTSVLADMRQSGKQLLSLMALRMPAHLSVETLLREGDPADQIVLAARKWKADVIVIGTHARGRLAGLLLGSTAQAVIRQAPCPVLTVAHDPHDHPARQADAEMEAVSPAA